MAGTQTGNFSVHKTSTAGQIKGQEKPIAKSPSAVRPLAGSPSQATLFEVEIAGVPLRLKSSHDEQTVAELVALVDRKINEALPLTKTGSIQNASILASLHLAEEYLLLQRKMRIELDNLEAKAQKVLSDIESNRSSQG